MLDHLLGTGHTCVDVRFAFWEEAGHPEVRNLRDPLFVKEYVARLDVAVNDAVVRVLVQVEQAAGDARDDVIPPLPVKQLLLTIGFCIQTSEVAVRIRNTIV